VKPSMFTFRTANKILMGNGAIEKIGVEAKSLNATRAFIVTDKGVMRIGLAERVSQILKSGGVQSEIFDQVEPEPSMENVNECVEFTRGKKYDLFVGVGGGSSMDVAKIISILATNSGSVYDYIGIEKIPKPGLPIILVPTTSGTGAEVTPNAIVTNKKIKEKKGIVSHFLLPEVAIVDPSLTLSLPPRITASTGVDALTHSIESYVSLNASPLSDVIALESIKLISHNLKRAVEDGNDIEARYNMALGSLLGGIALTNAGTGGVHALAYPLGGQFGIPHGLSNALMLPFIVEFNITSNLSKFSKIAAVMGENIEGLGREEAAGKAVEAVRAIVTDVGMPKRLREVGIPKQALPKIAESASHVTRLLANNPRKMTIDDIRKIYEEAF